MTEREQLQENSQAMLLQRQSRKMQVELPNAFDVDDVAREVYRHLGLSDLARLEAATGKKAIGAELGSSFPIVLTEGRASWLLKRGIRSNRIILPRNATPTAVLPYLIFTWKHVTAIEFGCCYRLLPYLRGIVTMLCQQQNVVEISIVGMCVALFRDLIQGQPNVRLINIALNPYDPFPTLAWLPPSVSLSSGSITTLNLSAAAAGPINDKLLVELFVLCPLLENVRLDGAAYVNDVSLQVLGQACRFLRSVIIHQCNGVTDDGIAGLCLGGPQPDMHTLTITGVEFGAQSVQTIAASMPSLRILETGFQADILPEVFETLFTACRSLHHVAFNAALAMVISQARTFLSAGALKSVTITEYTSRLRAKDVTRLARQLPDLRHLQMDLRVQTGDAIVKALVGRVTAIAHPQTGTVTYGGNLTKLQTVLLGSCNNVRDASVVSLILCNPSIRALTLVGAARVTDAVLDAMCALGAGLLCVDLAGSPLLSDVGVCALAAACRHLECVNFSRSAQLTDATVIALATHCPGLTTAVLAYCPQLTHTSLQLLSRRCRRLQRLVVPADALTDDQVAGMQAERRVPMLGIERIDL